MAVVPLTVRVVSDDAVPVPLDGFLIQAYTNPGDVFVTSGLTGNVTPGSGEVDLSLDSGNDYFIRASKDGYSIANLPASISIVDPPPDNELELTAVLGATNPVVVLSLKDEDVAAIDGVTARVYDDGDLFVTEGVTGGVNPGEIDMVLPGAPDPGQKYFVRWRPPDGSNIQNGNTQIFYVIDPLTPPQTNVFDFVMETPELPQSDDDAMCLVSGYLSDLSKVPIYEGILAFLPILCDPEFKVSGIPFPHTPAVLGRSMLVKETRVKTDKTGYVEVKLPKNSIINVHVYGLETPGINIISPIYIPDRSSAKLEDILLPYVVSVDTEAGSVSVDVGGEAQLDITVEGSNGQPDLDQNGGLLEFTSSDEEVATIEYKDGVLSVFGGVAGTAEISVARTSGTWGTRVPPVDDLKVTPSTTISVTVS
jgi:hypothetical protein